MNFMLRSVFYSWVCKEVGPGEVAFESRRVQEIFHFSKTSKPALRIKRSGVILTIRLHLAPRLRMSGVIPPLPPLCLRGVEGYKFTFFFPRMQIVL